MRELNHCWKAIVAFLIGTLLHARTYTMKVWKWIAGWFKGGPKNPLVVALFTGFLSYCLFILQTQVEKEKQLNQARFAALQDVTGLYGAMTSNLDQLIKARCELMDHRLTKAEINERSKEMQERLSKTRELAGALTFRLAALFSPDPPWYRRIYTRLRREILPADPKRIVPEDGLFLFSDFYEYYRGFETRAFKRASLIPVGVSCAADDTSYLEEFHHRIPFKFVRLYNYMAPSLGIAGLEIKIEHREKKNEPQILSGMYNGKPVKFKCLDGPDNRAICTVQ